METLKYTVISSATQYDNYCRILEELVFSSPKTRALKDEIELLTLLIENYDERHNRFKDADPIRLVKSLMADHAMKAKDLVEILGVSKGYVSDILHYKKGLSKEIIRSLADHFKLRQEAFNRPYSLNNSKIRKNRWKPLRKRQVA